MNNTIKLVISVALPLAVGGLSGFATARGVSTWYPTLVKPSFNPPAWVFGPVWTLLYIMMGVAAFLVWRRGLDADGVRIALTVFAIQLALNGLWSDPLFRNARARLGAGRDHPALDGHRDHHIVLLARGSVGGSCSCCRTGCGSASPPCSTPPSGGSTARPRAETSIRWKDWDRIGVARHHEPHDLPQALRHRRRGLLHHRSRLVGCRRPFVLPGADGPSDAGQRQLGGGHRLSI